MAIDVHSEVRRISRGHANWSHLESEIESLVTRVVADAKREQMERDCKAVTTAFSRNYEWSDGDRVDEIRDMIRAAFAATEPRDAGTERGAA